MTQSLARRRDRSSLYRHSAVGRGRVAQHAAWSVAQRSALREASESAQPLRTEPPCRELPAHPCASFSPVSACWGTAPRQGGHDMRPSGKTAPSSASTGTGRCRGWLAATGGDWKWTKRQDGLRASTGRPKSMTSGLPMPAATAWQKDLRTQRRGARTNVQLAHGYKRRQA